MPFSMNKTLLTVPQGIFKNSTSYIITVTIMNKKYDSLKKSQTLTFTTGQPPYGGSVTVNPQIGSVNSTDF